LGEREPMGRSIWEDVRENLFREENGDLIKASQEEGKGSPSCQKKSFRVRKEWENLNPASECLGVVQNNLRQKKVESNR